MSIIFMFAGGGGGGSAQQWEVLREVLNKKTEEKIVLPKR